ncbi:class II fumarate hydratase [Promicromonospora thailandica]|uniref:Fumarate hydratase class II n=1 Tax=Promicromonospora thailandica TaxID=765201 RepID=A0A9X2G728_9MICO|nr:class II fumarate hydratase [Promicromonospora thailandica]MCP2263106.1 fumarase, class II [Promicromonospora thailandica]BFF18484.1 class II fumarate hydratase [Promicromonospora thailandica]
MTADTVVSPGSAEPGDTTDYRIEHDTMGEVRVPANALYRAQTQRAVENFPISGTPLERAHIEALARVKKAAATANAELGVLDQDIADAIVAAADEVASGRHDAHFPIDVYQTGSGTSSNMNTNEVLATLATRSLGKDVHPNDHVNASQSSNDVFPTSVHVAATSGVVNDLVPALNHLADALQAKSDEFATVVKSGRTHLMDATPVTLGQEFGGYAAAVRYGVERLQAALPRAAEVPLGGTAVGTGINTPAGFPQRVIALLAQDTGLPLTEARDHFEAQSARDGLVELSGALRTIAVSVTKICNDLRWMGSGPNTGLGEIALPDLQPGSSIMPGKVNPVIPEAVLMVCARVIGNDATVAWAGASGSFELNVQIPVIAQGVLESIRLLSSSARVLADKTVSGITANVDRARALAESSPSIVTPLNRAIGYESAAKVAKHAVKEGITVRQAVLDLGFVERGEVTEEQLDTALDVLSMTRPPQA